MNYNKKKIIDDLLKRFKIEFEKNDRSSVYGYTQRKMAYNSNKIEGSTLTEDQTRYIFETNTILFEGDTVAKVDDILETSNHFKLVDYMIDITQYYGLGEENSLNEKEIQEFVEKKNLSNTTRKLEFLVDNQETYKELGEYWLVLAETYYQEGEYKKCLNATKQYKDLEVGVLRKDYDYAQILPFAILSAQESYTQSKYVSVTEDYLSDILTNIDNDDWDLRYFAAQTYNPIFLSSTLDNLYRFETAAIELQNVKFEGGKITFPAEYISDVSQIKITVKSGSDSKSFEDWSVDSVKRTKIDKGTDRDITSISATYSSTTAKKYDYKDGKNILTIKKNL